MKHAVIHDLDLATSRQVTEKAWESYRERFAHYNPTIKWETDRRAVVGFRAKGVALTGSLELREGAIDMDLEVPFLLKPFRKKALDVIEREIRHWVEKAKRGDL